MYFKDTENKLHWLDDERFINLLPSGSVKITDEEAEQIKLASTPAPAIPRIVSMRQARLALLQAGLLSTVSGAIAAGGEADQIEWEYAAEVNRNQPLVQNMKAGLNLSEDDLDNLFTLAASL